MTGAEQTLIDRIETLIHQDVGRNIGALFAATKGGLGRAAGALAAEPAPRIGLLTGFFVPLGTPPAAETDGPAGTALLAAALTRAGVACRMLTDAPCAGGCAAALRGAGLANVPLDVVAIGEPLAGAVAGWRDKGIGFVIAVERCGRSAGGPPRNMRGIDLSAHTAPLDELFLAGPWRTVAIGDGGNEIGLGALPRSLVARHVDYGELIACVTPADYLVMAGVSHWGCYGLIAALAAMREDWRAAMLSCLDPMLDSLILETMVLEGPGVDGVSQRQTLSIDAINIATHHAKLSAIRELVSAEWIPNGLSDRRGPP